LDERNWVWDFGGLKRSKSLIDGMNAKDWMDFMFDHTTIVAKDDPSLEQFRHLDSIGVIRLRILDAVGAEQFARFLFEKLDAFVRAETNERVRIEQVEFFENDKNSASYCLS
jgi:6-pyruvoyltetrahydropterin/6-carboxytetrahydropterin synthase